jgi:hypothetical protein
MNTLTSTNKDYFKSHLRFYADAISSGRYIKSNIVVLDSLFTTKSSGLTTDLRSSVKIYPPNRTGVVTVTSSVNANELIYFPVLANETVNVGIGTSTYSFTIGENNVVSSGTTYYLNDSIPVFGNKILTVKAFGGLLLSGGDLPSYSLSQSATTVSEGGSVNFTVNTFNVGSGTTLYYSTGGSMEAADFSNNSLTGSFTIVGTGATTGVATVTRTIANDILTEGNESFTFVVRTGSTTGPVVAISSSVTVADVVPSYSVTPSTTSANEGSAVTFTVTTTGVANSTILYWTILPISGTLSASDFSDAATSGSFTVNSNSGTITRTLAGDRSTESLESFQLEIRRSSTTGTVVATSETVYINDTSLNVGQNANGLTFGPVQVNRDGGNTANASDWYTICGLDTLPEGSSIALFIDTSGSMTLATVQASYNLLVSKLAAKNITITAVYNGNEDWITPFLVDLP